MRPQTARGRRRISTRRPNRPARKASGQISRTPGARQRTQAPAQSQHQIAPAPAGKRLSHAAHRRQKGRSGQIFARGPFRIRQSRQIRRAPPRHRQPEEIADRKGVELNSSDRSHPIFARRNFNPMARQPKPYLRLRRKLIEDASGKYFVGQLTSAIVKPCQKICASISLSKTKSSEFFDRSSFSRSSREKAR